MWNIFASELGRRRYDCHKLTDDHLYNWINARCEEEIQIMGATTCRAA